MGMGRGIRPEGLRWSERRLWDRAFLEGDDAVCGVLARLGRERADRTCRVARDPHPPSPAVAAKAAELSIAADAQTTAIKANRDA